MTLPHFTPADGLLAQLSELQVAFSGAVAHIRLNRPAKRNAINEALMQPFGAGVFFTSSGLINAS